MIMPSDPVKAHFDDVQQRIHRQAVDPSITEPAKAFFTRSHQLQYSYNFTWLDRPIIQYPQDIVAFQEVVNISRPDLIIETGIAHGGSLVFSASLLCGLVAELARPHSDRRGQRLPTAGQPRRR